MFTNFNEIFEGMSEIKYFENNPKKEFFKIFKCSNCFKSNVKNLNEKSSLEIASFFSQLYAYGNFNDEELEDCILYFVKNVNYISSLEVMYYTSFNQVIDSAIVDRIIDLDKNCEASFRIFLNEGLEYCPEKLMVYIANEVRIDENTIPNIYKIMRYFNMKLKHPLLLQDESQNNRWHKIFNYAIENNIVGEEMIIYLKDFSNNKKSLDHQMLKYLKRALDIYLID